MSERLLRLVSRCGLVVTCGVLSAVWAVSAPVSDPHPHHGMHGMHAHHPDEKLPPGNEERGEALFAAKNCSQCHALKANTKSFGPNLRGLFNPAVHGHAMTNGDVTYRIREGGGRMPPYGTSLSPQDLSDLLTYLHQATAVAGHPAKKTVSKTAKKAAKKSAPAKRDVRDDR